MVNLPEFLLWKGKGKTCMVEKPSYVKQLYLNHMFKIGLRTRRARKSSLHIGFNFLSIKFSFFLYDNVLPIPSAYCWSAGAQYSAEYRRPSLLFSIINHLRSCVVSWPACGAAAHHDEIVAGPEADRVQAWDPQGVLQVLYWPAQPYKLLKGQYRENSCEWDSSLRWFLSYIRRWFRKKILLFVEISPS
jgi:hypothetical protein